MTWPSRSVRHRLLYTGLAIGGVAGAFKLVVSGALTPDLGLGRSLRPLGPVRWTIEAPPELVFDVISQPYLGRTPRALREKLHVLERGTDMVLAAHFTKVGPAVATTVETVRFDRPSRVDFRLVRGPVPHVAESFELVSVPAGTELTWQGELGADLWVAGRWWGNRVAEVWGATVRASVQAVAKEAERRARHARPGRRI